VLWSNVKSLRFLLFNTGAFVAERRQIALESVRYSTVNACMGSESPHFPEQRPDSSRLSFTPAEADLTDSTGKIEFEVSATKPPEKSA
jgi:hypothetical protein